MGMISSGINKPKKIAQGRSIQIKAKAMLPVQCDGEPWRESSSITIKISLLNRANMLKHPQSVVLTPAVASPTSTK